MPSQYGECARIHEYFHHRVGRFLDIGAHDGVTFSNTRGLADLGWSGVLVEPSPASFVHLLKSYQGNPRVELVNAGITPVAGLMKFWANTQDGLSADALSSFVPSRVVESKKYPFQQIWVSSITWEMLLGKHQGPFEFVNIDVEGMNPAILEGLCNHERIVQPKMVCVEMDPELEVERMKFRLKQIGLGNQETIGGNLLAWE